MAQLTVGLDIGTSAVRAAELDISHHTPVLIPTARSACPPVHWSTARSETDLP